MIEYEEEQIKLIEEIDNTFTEINKYLSEINNKISNILQINLKAAKDVLPLINFFNLKENDTTHSILIDCNESNILDTSTDKKIDTDSSYKKIKSPFYSVSTSSTLIVDNILEQSTKEEELVPFDSELLPELFKKEYELKNIYSFIKNNESVAKIDIKNNFEELSDEKIKIFLDLLVRKNFIRLKNNYYEV